MSDPTMIRVARVHYDQALALIGRARDAEDAQVVVACGEVLQAYRLGWRVRRQTVALIAAFSEE